MQASSLANWSNYRTNTENTSNTKNILKTLNSQVIPLVKPPVH